MKNISFMICADAHLDSDFARDCDMRREEQRIAFDRAVDMIHEFGIEYLLIPGDLFDKRCPNKETVSYVKKKFAGLRHTKIIIAPGNHDPFTVDSSYYENDWPDNVYIFHSKKISMLEFNDKYRAGAAGVRNDFLFKNENGVPGKKGVRIYGTAFEGHFSKESMLCDSEGRVPKLSSDYVNILVMHGEAGAAQSLYNPIPEAMIKSCGFDLCALGHVHGYQKTDYYIYSGVLCSRGFDEPGDCGVVVGEITGDGRLLTEFIPINARKYVTVDIDITDAEDLTVDGICRMIEENTDRSVCCRVLLTGAVASGERIDTDAVQMKLTGHYPTIKVIDNTFVEADWRLIAAENSLRGIFVRRMLEKMREAGDDRYTRKNMEDALRAGLKAFAGTL